MSGRKKLGCLLAVTGTLFLTGGVSSAATIIDHNHTRIGEIPLAWITQAKSTLRIAYGHTSHGSQLVTGMAAVRSYYGTAYSYSSGGTGGALDFRDKPFSGASDLGNPNRTAWATATRNYLAANPSVNVIIWSWCGQVDGSVADIDLYLGLMNQLELDYPSVKFVYMTGHLNGTGATGNVNLRNEQIRTYCRNNNKILFDFADIESYDPGRVTNFMALNANDQCNYSGGNWATQWITANPAHELTGVKNVCGYCSHSDGLSSNAYAPRLNCVQKGGAAWWLWARLAGWAGSELPTLSLGDQAVIEGDSGTTTIELTATLSAASATEVTVDWATANGTATAGQDYVAGSGALSFSPSETQKPIPVTVNGDTAAEGDETFRVVLSNAVGADIADGDGLVTILDDDGFAGGEGFHPLPPCRLIDTREAGQGPAIAANTARTVTMATNCAIPSDAAALSLNVTVVGATSAGYLTLYAAGTARPLASTINFSTSQVRANNAVVRVGTGGQVVVFAGLTTGSVHVIVDVAGYFDLP